MSARSPVIKSDIQYLRLNVDLIRSKICRMNIKHFINYILNVPCNYYALPLFTVLHKFIPYRPLFKFLLLVASFNLRYTYAEFAVQVTYENFRKSYVSLLARAFIVSFDQTSRVNASIKLRL